MSSKSAVSILIVLPLLLRQSLFSPIHTVPKHVIHWDLILQTGILPAFWVFLHYTKQRWKSKVTLPYPSLLDGTFISKGKITSHNVKAKPVPYQCAPFLGHINLNAMTIWQLKSAKVHNISPTYKLLSILLHSSSFIQGNKRQTSRQVIKTTVSACLKTTGGSADMKIRQHLLSSGFLKAGRTLETAFQELQGRKSYLPLLFKQ